MNLKEAFRYQNFLDNMMRTAAGSITDRNHCLKITKTHLRNKSNPDTDDIVEIVETESFYNNDDVLSFMEWLVDEKMVLTRAISAAKSSTTPIDLDTAIETNKFRQQVYNAIKSMLRFSPRKTIEQGRDYKFNIEGNQVPYYYDIEMESTEYYDKNNAKQLMRDMISFADITSAEIDSALINTQVDYLPKYDVNESFDDIMEVFINNK